MQTIIVDMTPGFRMPTIYYSQGDVGTQFAIDLRSRFGDSFPTGTTVTIQATKPSGFGFSVAATSVTNGVATFTTTAEMTDEFGRFPAELKVTKTGLTLFTANFYMDGERNTHPEGTTDGSQETVIPELTQLVERVEDAASSVLDMTVVANTLPAGSDATYSYDEETNTATFGIPKGADGSLASGVLAPTYSSSSTYAVGDYVYYSGSLYRCTTAITTAEAWTSGHWTQVALAPEVSDLKSDLYETREFFNVTSDARANTSAFSFDISETLVTTKKYNVTVKCDTTLDANCTIYLRNSGGNTETLGTFASGETSHSFLNIAPVENATMVRFAKGMVGAKYTVIVSEVVSLTEKALDEIDVLDNDIKTITEKTPITKFGTFEKGNWQNVSTFQTSVQYRVACRTAITFDKDVTIACTGAFFLQGYVDGVYFGSGSTIDVPKNKPLKLIIRRIWEDSSETADVDEFASTVFVLDYSEAAEYNLLKDTFAGIEMFRTAGFIGDSYTAQRLGLSWVDIVGNRTGVQTTKFAKSGDNAGAWIIDNANGLPALLNDTAKDLYWIALGINDADRYDDDASYLGSIADISGSYENYPDTFYGNMGHIIEAIQAHAPSAKIVLYKPLYRGVWRTLGGVSADKSTHMVEIRDAIEDIAEHYSLPFMDAFDDVLFISQWYTHHMDYDISAGNHPSLLLYPAIASANMRLFSKCVQDNADYFMGLYYTD